MLQLTKPCLFHTGPIQPGSQSGFVALLLVLTSTLLFVLFGFLIGYKTMVFKKRQQHACHKESLEAQVRQAQILRQLLDLNPLARSLRKKRMAATKVRNSVRSTPPALIAAQIALEIIKAKQRALRWKQQGLVQKSLLDWQTTKVKSLGRGKRSSVKFQHPLKLPVDKIPDVWGSPTYRESFAFSKKQTQSLSWNWRLPVRSPILVKMLGTRHLDFHVSCSSTLKKRGQKWTPILKKVRPWLRPA